MLKFRKKLSAKVCIKEIYNEFKLNVNKYYFSKKSVMNFLAHVHLSGKNTDLMVGNFIAVAVKGNASL
jgi:hypothetical protein